MISREDIKSIVTATAIGVVGLGALTWMLLDLKFENGGVTRAASSGLTLMNFFWLFYFRWGWKLPLIKYIAYKENLNGTWFGEYNSVNNGTGEVYHGEICLVIKQTFLSIGIFSTTNKYTSFSYSASLLYNTDHDNIQLVYLYSQDKINPTDDKLRKGVSELRSLSGEKETKLLGTFRTNLNSVGSLNLKFITNKHHNSFEDIKKIINGK